MPSAKVVFEQGGGNFDAAAATTVEMKEHNSRQGQQQSQSQAQIPTERQQQRHQRDGDERISIQAEQLTRVNGIGLWNSWTRNFKTPLLAMLDLLDNSVDAAFLKAGKGEGGGGGEIRGGKRPVPDLSSSSSSSSSRPFQGKIRIDADVWWGGRSVGGGGGVGGKGRTRRTTGIKIVNNSSSKLKDLGKIMEVYSSSKGRVEHGLEHSHLQSQRGNGDDDDDGDEVRNNTNNDGFAETIGENGVGLKQGCATLSDLSFVLVRSGFGGGGGRRMGMAVIAQRLQSAAGVYLPHFYFRSTGLAGLKNEMMALFSSSRYIDNVAECVKTYGDGDFEDGVDRLLRHFDDLIRQGGGGDDDEYGGLLGGGGGRGRGGWDWGDEEYTFSVVLHQLKHGGDGTNAIPDHGHSSSYFSDVSFPSPNERQYSDNAHFLMQELRDELPRHYIHVNMDVRVAGERISFHYWQLRLAELTTFFVNIDQNRSYMDAIDWNSPENGYPLRIFCGFDSVRLTAAERGDGGGSGACSLYVYSRYTGRLIKHEEDARALLKLSSGGTEFSQALTIIVDDMLGNLPLNPTKQDVAFGEQAHGDVHKRNIYAWLSAVTRLYYKYHLETKCDGKKGRLSQKVKAFGTPMVDASRIKLLDASDFTEFFDVHWKIVRGTIAPLNRMNIRVSVGADTLRRFTADRSQRRDSSSTVVAAAAKGAEKRKRLKSSAVKLEDDDDDEEEEMSLRMLKRRRNEKGRHGRTGLLEVVDSNDEDGDGGNDRPHVIATPATSGGSSRQRQGAEQDGTSRHDEEKSDDDEDEIDWSNKRRLREMEVVITDLKTQNEILREAVKKNKEKAHERKLLVRQIYEANTMLKKRIVELEKMRVGGGSSSKSLAPGAKSTRELMLEEQVDQLTDALARSQREGDDSAAADVETKDKKIKKLKEQLSLIKKENIRLVNENALKSENLVKLE